MLKSNHESAFPVPEGQSSIYCRGMELRDFIAIKAMVAMFPQMNTEHVFRSDTTPKFVALRAYKYADAMMAAREVV